MHSDVLLPAEIAPTLQASMWASVGALCLAAVGPMSCYLTYFVALPLGGWGTYKAWQVSQAAPLDSSERGLSQVALVGGLMATLLSAMFTAIMLMIVAMYAAIFLVAIIGGVAGM